MTRIIIAGLVVVASCALLLGSAAHSITTSRAVMAPPRPVAAPAVSIDVFELMGNALGELPPETGSMH
jgi:hypothetical protein